MKWKSWQSTNWKMSSVGSLAVAARKTCNATASRAAAPAVPYPIFVVLAVGPNTMLWEACSFCFFYISAQIAFVRKVKRLKVILWATVRQTPYRSSWSKYRRNMLSARRYSSCCGTVHLSWKIAFPFHTYILVYWPLTKGRFLSGINCCLSIRIRGISR